MCILFQMKPTRCTLIMSIFVSTSVHVSRNYMSIIRRTYSRVRVDKNVSDRFAIRNGLKQRDALSPMLFNFALE